MKKTILIIISFIIFSLNINSQWGHYYAPDSSKIDTIVCGNLISNNDSILNIGWNFIISIEYFKNAKIDTFVYCNLSFPDFLFPEYIGNCNFSEKQYLEKFNSCLEEYSTKEKTEKTNINNYITLYTNKNSVEYVFLRDSGTFIDSAHDDRYTYMLKKDASRLSDTLQKYSYLMDLSNY